MISDSSTSYVVASEGGQVEVVSSRWWRMVNEPTDKGNGDGERAKLGGKVLLLHPSAQSQAVTQCQLTKGR